MNGRESRAGAHDRQGSVQANANGVHGPQLGTGARARAEDQQLRRPSGPVLTSSSNQRYFRQPSMGVRLPVRRSQAPAGSGSVPRAFVPLNNRRSNFEQVPMVNMKRSFVRPPLSQPPVWAFSTGPDTPAFGADYALGNGTSLHIRSSQGPIDVNRFPVSGASQTQAVHVPIGPSLEYVNSGMARDKGMISGYAHHPLGYPSTQGSSSVNFISGVGHRIPPIPSSVPTDSSLYMDVTGVAHQIQPYSSSQLKPPENTSTKVAKRVQRAPPPYVPLPIDTYDPNSPHYRYKDELIDIGGMDKIGGRVAFCLEKFNLRVKRVLHKICPCFYALFYSAEKEFTIYKAILGFPFGFGIGLLFYYCVIDRLKLSAFLRFLLGSVTILIMSMGYARSIKIRCIVWLIFPCFFGKSGRDILMTMAIGALLTGPISNTMDNFRESVRTITCMTELMINITIKRFELTGKPIFNIVRGFVGSKKMDEMALGMRKALSPIKAEVEDTKETKAAEVRAARMDAELGTDRNEFFKKNEAKNAAILAKEDGGTKTKAYKTDTTYMKKLDYRCNNIWGMAVDTCKKSFQGAWDRCLSAIPVIGYLICWPTKLDFFCYLVKLFPMPIKCDSRKMLNSGFGGAYGEGDDAGSELEKGMNVKLEYQITPKNGKVDAMSIQDMQKGMKNEFGKKQRFFNFIITLCERVMAFAFIQIFITSFQYYNSYTTSIKFDNCYMTDYFRRIERRRRQRGRSCLVPLKKLESKILIEPTKWKLLPGERKKFSKGTLRLIINVVLFVLIFMFDRLIYEILDIVARHSYVVYTQKGVHDIKLEVIGTGMLAKLVRSILKGFHERHELDHKVDNLICLPYPTKTPDIYYYKVFGTIGAIWILSYFEAYGLRLRRCICSFFFPKREKQRILNLYNSTLKKRAGYARSIRHQVRRLAREHHLSMEYDTVTALRQQCPYLCGWLKLIGKGRASCAACKGKGDSSFYHCATKDCNFVYCQSCWDDLRHHCYACTPESRDDESSLSEGYFGSEDEAHDAAED